MIKIRKVDKKIFIPISAGLLYFPFFLIRKNNEVKNHWIISSLCSSMGMILSFIPLILSRLNMKKAMSKKNLMLKEKIKTNDIEISLIYNKGSDEIKRKKFYYIFLSSILDCLQTLLITINYNKVVKVNFWLLDLLFISALSYLILNVKLFKHQIISMILINIFGVILDFLFGNLIELFNNIGYFLLRIFIEFCFSLSLIINKYCMEFKFSPPYEICFFIGLYTFCFYLIILIFASLIPCNLAICIIKDENNNKYYFDNFLIYISKINIKEFILFLIEMIIVGLINILTILTIKYYTPCHVIIILIFGRILILIENFFVNIELYNIISLIIMALTFFILLIYTEIVILNFCDIQKNTKQNIEKRSDLDAIHSEKNCVKEDNLHDINVNNNEYEDSDKSSRSSSW